MTGIAKKMISAAAELRDTVHNLSFEAPVAYVYNPLDYAWDAHCSYLSKYASNKKKVLMMGMNPGPFGMAQTGVPFGEIAAVRDWMKICVPVDRPAKEHPKRLIEGFDCPKSEVSGRRLWGLFSEQYPAAKDFFRDHFVLNYCPLVFMEESARNLTPDKIPATQAEKMFSACDAHLRQAIEILQPEWAIGVGGFALKRLQSVIENPSVRTGTILHPSPASPAANRGWAEKADRQLRELGIWK
jgi:single-strand selective monofunctional uracil DNA glycosylase